MEKFLNLGLSDKEACDLLKKQGPNHLPEQPPPSNFLILLSQFKSPLVYVLLVACLVTVFLKHFSDASIIFLAITINTVLGFIQESKAGKALFALKKLVAQRAEVIRSGKRKSIDAVELVSGDVVLLHAGVKVPADGILLHANRLYLDEAMLTGESIPVSKNCDNIVFMGTVVTSGQGVMKIQSTGAMTKIGQIAKQVQTKEEDTPLGKQLTNFSRKIVIGVLGLISLVFAIGLLRGSNPVELFTTAVALAVSSIPEGLIISLTVILAIGMQRILRRRGLVRKLASAETLGGVTTICVDKTGTLTEGKMQVVDVVGDEIGLSQQVLLANDLDDPLVVAIFEWGRGKIKDFVSKHPRFDSIPFSSKNRYFVSLHPWQKNNILFMNGAPDLLLTKVNLSKSELAEYKQQLDELTSQGKKVIGFIKKELPKDRREITENDLKNGFSWVGMLALSDPIRLSVKEALQATREAGIATILITGDYPATAEFVLSELGIPVNKNEILLGSDLDKLSAHELAVLVKRIKLFARTTPEQKLKIVEALKANGEIVAMMGDGVNDAPALHRADIGIVVNEASDVARESADLVLLDSNFATVVAAIEEGRGMFDNLRKIILYLLSDAFAEILVVIGGMIIGLPLPITAVQIIWINLVSDGFPGLALTVDPKRINIMKELPRNPKERLVNSWMFSLILLVSSIAGLIALLVFIVSYKLTQDLVFARSMTFLTLGLNSLAYVFSVRLLTTSFWRSKVVANYWLLVAVVAGFGLQALPFVSNTTRNFFGVVQISLSGWLLAIGLSVMVFLTVEVFKLVYEHKHHLKANYLV